MVISPRKAATTRERDEGGGPRALTMFFLDLGNGCKGVFSSQKLSELYIFCTLPFYMYIIF